MWSNIPSMIDPVFLEIGPFSIRYYSLMYIVAIGLGYLIVMHRIKKEKFPYDKDTIENYAVWFIIGMIIGGRLGYVLFYNLPHFIQHPLEIFSPVTITKNGLQFTGIRGISYHGGLIGILTASYLFCKKHKYSYLNFGDMIAPLAPLCYLFGRLGNFMNGELYGRETSAAIGMYFPMDPDQLLRHPSQLYEAFLEGILLFIIMWNIRKKKALKNLHLSIYLAGYGAARFIAEFFREPDEHIGFVLFHLSMGQLLCLAMIAAGLISALIINKRVNHK